MLILVHNIHIGLNLNSFNELEQNYSWERGLMNIDNINMENNNVNINNENINNENIKDISFFYYNNYYPFSLLSSSYSSLGL
jgi:hypothetical protein